MANKLFHPILVVDEQYIRGRAESISVELTDEQLVKVADGLEKTFEREHLVAQIHEMAERLIEEAAGQ